MFYSSVIICLVVDILVFILFDFIKLIESMECIFHQFGKFLAIVISTVVSPLFSFLLLAVWQGTLMYLILSSFLLNLYHFLSLCSRILNQLCLTSVDFIHWRFILISNIVFSIYEILFSFSNCFWVYFSLLLLTYIYLNILSTFILYSVSLNVSIWNLCKIHSVSCCFLPLALRIMFLSLLYNFWLCG